MARTGIEKTTLTMALLRLLSHQFGRTIGTTAIDSNNAMNGMTLHSGKHVVMDSAVTFPR
jgi:hypothetical protein